MIEVDVCIISFARNNELKDVTEKGIESLLASEDDNILFNVFVVESNHEVSYEKYKNVKTIYTNSPFGYHSYLNLARKQGKANYVALCNSDLIYEKKWASNIISEMNNNEKLLSSSPFCPQTQTRNEYPNGIYEGYTVRRELAGWCIFQKREIYNIIGELDETFVFWFCDNDYSMELKKNKITHALITSSIVNHHEKNLGKTVDFMNEKQKQEMTYGQLEVFKNKWDNISL